MVMRLLLRNSRTGNSTPVIGLRLCASSRAAETRPMKLEFQTSYRFALWFLLVLVALSIWAAVQPETNTVPEASVIHTNNAPAFVRVVQRWEQNPLTFKLD